METQTGADSSYVVTLTPTLTLTFWTQNQQASTDCRGLLFCQVSSHSDQEFSFYRANIPAHVHRNKLIAV